MSSVVLVSEIVKVLINDAYLIDQRTPFTDLLGTPPAEIKQWEDLYRIGNISGYEHFNNLIQEWAQRVTNPSLGQLRQILETCECRSVKDSLKFLGDDGTIIKINLQTSASSSGPNKAISFGVMQPTTFFTGRDTEVQQLSELFLNQSPPKIVVISGMGGQGKTELCRQFIKTLKNKNPTTAFTWLGGDNATNLTSSLVQLAQALQIPTTIDGNPIPLTQLIVKVSEKISNSSSNGWLVVIDNVDEVYPEFKQAVDLLVRHGAFVLVTTRRIDVLSGQAKQMKLDVMKEEDAHNLIKKCLNQPLSEEDIGNLCHELGNHVLALRHAIAYIKAQQVENRTSYGIKDYLEEFAKDKALLNDEGNMANGYEKTIFIIVTQSINTIFDKHGRIGKRAAGLMEILCLVRPDGISRECLQKFQTILDEGLEVADTTLDSMNVDLLKALLLLKKYSLITFEDRSFISIHRLVQKVTKCHCGAEANLTILKAIEPEQCPKEELQQVVHLWEQADAEIVKDLPNLACQIFDRMSGLSLVLKLKPFALRNHQLLTQLLGPDDVDTIAMQHCVACAIKKNGDYEEALPKFMEVLEKKNRVLGADHPDTLSTIGDLARTFHRLDRYDEALEWYEWLLESRIRVLGSNHKKTMTTRNNMAVVLNKLGRTDEALTLYNQVLDGRKDNAGQSHSIATRHNIATVLFEKDELQKAKAEFEAVIKLAEGVLGEEHDKTLRSKYWLAKTLWKLGTRDKALSMMKEVLLSQEKVLGPNHPHTTETREKVTVMGLECCSINQD